MSTQLKYGHILRAISSSAWAIYRPTFDLIMEIAEMRAAGQTFNPDQIAERLDFAAAKNGARGGQKRADYVAVIPIYGVISQRQNLMSQTSGGTSVDSVKAMFREAVADTEVGHIIFDIDSPGGTVDGIAELADEIRAARGEKPMTSVVNTAMHSAALWLGSQADEIVSMPTGQMGSIGIISTHIDDTAAREKEGIKRTVIAMPPGKADGWGGDPISEDAIAEVKEMQEELYGMFTGAVSKGRNAPVATVRDVWGKNARIFSAKAAQKNGLIDRVDTLDNTINRAIRQMHSGSASQAAGARKFFGGRPLAEDTIAATQIANSAVLGSDEDGMFADTPIQPAADVYIDDMAQGDGPNPEPGEEPAETETDPQTTVPSEVAEEADDSPATVEEQLASLPFARRLALVAAETEALAEHTRNRVAMRSEEGRGLSEETVSQIARLTAASAVLGQYVPQDASTATAEPEPSEPAAPTPPRQGILDIFEAATRGGYQLPS